MANYTKLNLKEVEDQSPKFGLNEMEFRSARVPLELENSGLSFLRVDPNYRVPLGHNHTHPETAMRRIRTGAGTTELCPDSAEVDGGELPVGGVRASALADEFGTPLVVY